MCQVCDGMRSQCPADVISQRGTLCMSAAGACAAASLCDGLSPQCAPVRDRVCVRALSVIDVCVCQTTLLTGSICRPAVSQCDLAELCDGRALGVRRCDGA
jgi:hypothetical protein